MVQEKLWITTVVVTAVLALSHWFTWHQGYASGSLDTFMLVWTSLTKQPALQCTQI